MVALPRRRRCRPRPPGLVVVAVLLLGLTLLTGLMVLANAGAVSAGPGGAGTASAVVAERSLRPEGTGPSPRVEPSAVPRGTPGGVVAGSRRAWEWPLVGVPELLRGFESPRSEWGRGHRGVDLAAKPGDVVRAAGAGVVSWAGRVAGRGVVTVTHDGGLRTTYEPVAAELTVGRRVAAGAAIGTLEAGVAHCAGRPCLHWGLLRGRAYLDPLALLDTGRPVLLPYWPTALG